jgi:excisionase family DNA binding protein
MTIDQLCEELAIRRSTFEDWRRKGRAPQMHQLPNRQYRIRRSDFISWLDSMVVAAV